MKKLPIKITPDPIITSVVEIRFKPDMPNTAVVGAIFRNLSKKYKGFKNVSVPEEIRQTVPQYRYSANIEVSDDHYTIGIAENAITQKIKGQYGGWKSFSNTFNENIEMIRMIPELFNNIERVGLRYINFFKNESGLFNSFKLNIDFEKSDHYNVERTMYSTTLKYNEISLNLRIEDKARTDPPAEGIVLDIDAFYSNCDNINMSNLLQKVNELHDSEKELFFNLMKDDFLQKFSPEYEE